MANRFRDLVALLPRGGRQTPQGRVLPHRSGPHEFIFETEDANTNHQLYVDRQLVTSVTTDANARAVVRVRLEPGNRDLRLVAPSGKVFRAPVTPLRVGTLLSADGDVLDEFDDLLDEWQDSLSLETASSRLLEPTYGARTGFANRLGFFVEAYRFALRRLMSVFRHEAGRREGVGHAAEAVTGSAPLFIPQAWKPRWQNGYVWETPFGPDAYVRLEDGSLDDLAQWLGSASYVNTRSIDYVHPQYAGNSAANTFPGPYADPPNGAERLAVCFFSGYDGGDVYIEGVTAGGSVVSETVSAGAYPTAADIVVNTANTYVSVTVARKATVGAAPAAVSLGLADSRFVKVIEANSRVPLGASTLWYELVSGAPALGLDAPPSFFPDVRVRVPETGRYTLQGLRGRSAVLDSLTFPVGSQSGRLVFGYYGLQNVSVVLSGTIGPAGVATLMQDALQRDPDYGNPPGGAVIGFTGVPPDGETLELTDAWGYTLTFEFDTNGSVGAGAVEVDVSSAVSAADAALALAEAVAGSGLALFARNVGTACEMVQGGRGTDGNTSITTGGGGPTNWSAPPAFTGGSNAITTGVENVATGYDDFVRVDPGAGSMLPPLTAPSAARVRIPDAPGTRENVRDLFGHPFAQFRDSLVSFGSLGNRVLEVDDADNVPDVLETVQVHAPFDATNTAGPGPINATVRPQPMEVRFSADFDGGDVRLDGTDIDGENVSETFSAPEAAEFLVASGAGASDTSSLANPNGRYLSVTGGVPDTVRVGMLFRVTSGAAAGDAARVAATYYDRNTGTRALYLQTPLGVDPAGADWEVLQDVTVRGEQLFETVTAVAHPTGTGGTLGTIEVKVREGAERYGYDLRVGRDDDVLDDFGGGGAGLLQPQGDGSTALVALPDAASGSNGTISAGAISGQFTDATASAFSPGDVGKWIRVRAAANPENLGFFLITSYTSANTVTIIGRNLVNETGTVTSWTMEFDAFQPGAPGGGLALTAGDTNDGVHEILDQTGAPEQLLVRHERARYGAKFAGGLVTAGRVFPRGEVVRVIGRDATPGVDTLIIDQPAGLLRQHSDGSPVEVDGEVDVDIRGLPEGGNQLVVDVDAALTPTTNVSTALTFVGSALPEGWAGSNVDYATTGRADELGPLHDFPLLVVAAAGGGVTLEFDVPQVLDRRGFVVDIRFLVQQHASKAGRSATASVTFDGGASFTTGSSVSVLGTPGSATPEAVREHFLDQVSVSAEVPRDAITARVRFEFAGFSAGEYFSLHRAIVGRLPPYLGVGTLPLRFQELLYVWSAEDLTDAEDEELDLLVERAAPAHVPTIPRDVTEYTAGAADNLVGLYTTTDWAGATLENLQLVPSAPSRLSYVQPTRVSRVEGEALSFVSPSNAALAETADVDGPFPEAVQGDGARLYADGVPVPTSPVDDGLATQQIGTALGTDGTVTITVLDEGTRANAYTVEVTVPAGDSSLIVEETALGVLVVRLATSSGTPIADENRAQTIARAIDALDRYSATYLPGTGALALNAAEGPLAFSGASPTPWRFTSATEVQVASAAAGDAAAYIEFNPAAAYTLDYDARLRATSPILDLGASAADYMWHADLALHVRKAPEAASHERTQLLLLRGNRTATLRLNADTAADATLIRDDGVTRGEVRRSAWRFDSPQVVRILDGTLLGDRVEFTLTYTAQRARYVPAAGFRLEHRAAATSGGVTSEAWAPLDVNGLVDRTLQYHQLRVTLTGVVDTRDVRITGLGLKGFALYAAPPRAPGLVP